MKKSMKSNIFMAAIAAMMSPAIKLGHDLRRQKRSKGRKAKNMGRAQLRYKGCPARYCNRAFPGALRVGGRYARRKWTTKERQMAEG